MDLSKMSRKEKGALGESLAAGDLRRKGFEILERNLVRKMGELDLIAREGETLHFVEVKTILCTEFPASAEASAGRPVEDEYDPSVNLHEVKVRKVARMGEWYVAEHDWEGEWQVDAVLVWLRRADGAHQIQYIPQIV